MAYPEAQSVSGLTLDLGGEISSGNGLELDLGYEPDAFAARVAHFEKQGNRMPEHTLSFVVAPTIAAIGFAETPEEREEAALRFADQVVATVALMAENRFHPGDLETQNDLLEGWWGQVSRHVFQKPFEGLVRKRMAEFGLAFPDDIARGF